MRGSHYTRFLDVASAFAEEVKNEFPVKGMRIDVMDWAETGILEVFRIQEAYEQLSRDEEGKFPPPHAEHFRGDVRVFDFADRAGLPGLELLAVYFAANARTKPHVHATEQLLFFIRGAGFIAFPGVEEQIVDEGGIAIVPGCELHMHGATPQGPTCHVALRLPGKTNWKPQVPAEWRQFTKDR